MAVIFVAYEYQAKPHHYSRHSSARRSRGAAFNSDVSQWMASARLAPYVLIVDVKLAGVAVPLVNMRCRLGRVASHLAGTNTSYAGSIYTFSGSVSR